jgi:signal transduction histidine kinase
MRVGGRASSVSRVTLRFSRPAAVDAAIVVLAIGLAEFEAFKFGDVPGPQLGRALPLLLLLVAPLVVRRRFPLLACVLVFAGLDVFGAVWASPEGLEVIAPVATASYAVAAHGSRRSALGGLAVIVIGYTIYALQDPVVLHGGSGDSWAAAFFGVAALALWLAGVFVHTRDESERLAGRAAALERESQLAVSEERARMARELHDIVSHNLSVVVLQAAGARAAGASASTLEKIEHSGREALVEMRRLLGVLREDGESTERAPQPGIAQLEVLTAGVTAAGLPVDLSVDGDCERLTPAVELSVYRIVQEALTNALKHAGPASVEVHIHCAADALTVDVIDDGAGTGQSAAGGHGLLGMRERVALFGGELHAGPRPEGGFAVHATLPVAG